MAVWELVVMFVLSLIWVATICAAGYLGWVLRGWEQAPTQGTAWERTRGSWRPDNLLEPIHSETQHAYSRRDRMAVLRKMQEEG